MFAKIRKRTQDALLREELLCGEADFRTLAEAIAGAIFVSQGKRPRSPGRRNDGGPASHGRPRVVRDEAGVRKTHSVSLPPCECVGAAWFTWEVSAEKKGPAIESQVGKCWIQ